MENQSKVVTIECYKFASLVKVYLKCLQILSSAQRRKRN